MSEVGVIHEQGDYGIFQPLNEQEQEKVRKQQEERARNDQRRNDHGAKH